MPKWQSLLASGVHILLYVLMLAMPLTGWIMASAEIDKHETLFFGTVPVYVPGIPGLPAPVRRRHLPPLRRPVVKRFQVLFVEVPPPRQKQDRSGRLRGRGPVNPAERPAVGGLPAAFNHSCGDGAAIEHLGHLANSGLSGVVTFW